MLSAYPACFFKEDTGYSVIFPDLDYLATCGDSLDDAIYMAVDCLAGYLYSLKIDGETAASPSSPQEISPSDVAKSIDENYTYLESFVNLVTVDVEEYAKTHFNKSVKKTLTIPEWLNISAQKAGINFSQVLQEALMQKLQLK